MQLPMSAGRNFPVRRQCRDLPDELTSEVVRQVHVALSGYYTRCHVSPTSRIYASDYGKVLPHRDVATYPDDNTTILVYLTDDFSGGELTVKVPRSKEHELGHLAVTVEPRVGYGIVFLKDYIHYTAEQYAGSKVILLMDADIME
jgi:hypothetical protein